MISVVIPLYNKGKSISKTLESVLNQTFQNFEIVVVDDGSTDDSVSEVLAIDDNRIRLIHQENAGVSAARNKGIQESRYDLIAFLDADDEWKADYLDTQYDLYKKYPECSVYACNYEFKKSNGEIDSTIIRMVPFQEEDGILSNYFEVASHSHPPLWTSAVMVKKQAIESINGFPVGIKSGEDLLTWARLAVKYKIAYTKSPKAIYNQGEGYDYSKCPPRKQDSDDYVGRELKEIYHNNNKIKRLRQYISLWHKMRASVAIRFGNRQETVYETLISIRFNPFNYKTYAFLILAILPNSMRKSIIKMHK